MYTCKLRLLQYGLVDEVAIVDAMGAVKGAKSKATKGKEDDSDDSDDSDESGPSNSKAKDSERSRLTGRKND